MVDETVREGRWGGGRDGEGRKVVGVVDEVVKEGRWGGGQVGEGRKVIRVMDEMVRRCKELERMMWRRSWP